ncbi:MAG TPA: peptidylprolyl isomerase [Pseudolabrys sp.]|jgi:hypothetical protein|nr:peptidylprolyl isomerase [Pseudolabrys sp.]HEV2629384.1 peptidylprolyl isomerase [Pseudolabrys sp.]
MRTAFLILSLVVAALSVSGCTHCGWIWDQGPHACQSDDVH